MPELTRFIVSTTEEMSDKKDKMFSQQDRDLLIRLDTKFDNLSKEVMVVSETLRTRISNVETRVDVIEKEHYEVPPKDTYERFVKVEDGYKRIKVIMWFLGALAVVISWTTGFLNQILTLFSK